jgi:hypothetical protein
MESIRNILVQNVAVGVARSAQRSQGRSQIGQASRDLEYEDEVCRSLRAWGQPAGDELSFVPDAGCPPGFGLYLLELGPKRFARGSRLPVLIGDLSGASVGEAWRVFSEVQAQEGSSVALLIYRSRGPNVPEPAPFFGDLLVPWWGNDPLSESFLRAGLSTAVALVVAVECHRLGHKSPALTEVLQATTDLECRGGRLWKLAQWAQWEENRGPKAHRRVVVAQKAFDSYVRRLDDAEAALEEELRGLPSS